MNECYQRLLELTRNAIYHYRAADGTILTANRGLVEVLDLDCPPEDLVGRRLSDVLHHVEAEGGRKTLAGQTGEVRGREYHFRTLKGEDRWVIHDSYVTTHPATGEQIIGAIAQDITERKRAEKTLQKHRDHLEQLVRKRTAELDAARRDRCDASQVPVSAQGCGGDSPEPSLVLGHHLHPDAARVRLPLRGHGLVFTQGAGMGGHTIKNEDLAHVTFLLFGHIIPHGAYFTNHPNPRVDYAHMRLP